MGKQGGKGKKKDARPARAAYWNRGTLEKHKVRKLMLFCGMTKEAATKLWRATRHTRIKKASAPSAPTKDKR